MGQTVVEKIAQEHLAEGPNRPLRTGDFVSIRPWHIMTHDNTSAVMSKFKAIGAKRVKDPKQPVFALDHDIQNTSEENLSKYRKIEAFAKEHGIDFYPAGTGIGHQVMCEKAYVVPGSFVVASDSHSNMYGAIGAIGTPVVRTDAAAVWATGEFWWQIPRTVKVVLEGRLPEGSTGKDVIIALCGLYNHEEVLNAAVEFTGPGVASLSMDARMSISNMSTEWGSLTGWFPCDEVTLAWLKQRQAELKAESHPPLAGKGAAPSDRITDEMLAEWKANPPMPDADAQYAARIVLNLSEVTPHLSGPDTVQVMQSVAVAQQKKVAIQKAYLVSCVNSRLEDLEAAARVLKGKKIAPTVKFYLAPASKSVQAAAEKSGAWQTIVAAGAIVLPPSCGPCIGLGTGLLEPGEVGISATNRNFKGRMGSRDAKCYLASPEVVAASAIAGYISAPEGLPQGLKAQTSTATIGTAEAVSFPRGDAGDGKQDGAVPRPSPAAAENRDGAEPRPHTTTSHTGNGDPTRHFEDLTSKMTIEAETVSILPGFPERVEGRLIFMPPDNVNTDAIYGKDYTYRDDMTPEMMAKVIMENYDPKFAERTRAGDVIVGGYNFGTGSSREQAATSLKAKGIPLVIAGSFSQTYLRNAFNNGFLCIEVPAFVNRVREMFAAEMKAGEKTIIPGDEITVDFTSGTITFRGEKFQFPPMGTVPQSLVIAGGVENLVARKLGLAANV